MNCCIALKFDWCLGSTAAETPVKCQSDLIIYDINLKTLWYKSQDFETFNWYWTARHSKLLSDIIPKLKWIMCISLSPHNTCNMLGCSMSGVCCRDVPYHSAYHSSHHTIPETCCVGCASGMCFTSMLATCWGCSMSGVCPRGGVRQGHHYSVLVHPTMHLLL